VFSRKFRVVMWDLEFWNDEESKERKTICVLNRGIGKAEFLNRGRS
jgi:hypothetical protein